MFGLLIRTIVWTISVRGMTCFQSVSDFSQRFSRQPNSEKNKLGCTKAQPQRGEMSIEQIYPPGGKPQRGEMCITSKL